MFRRVLVVMVFAFPLALLAGLFLFDRIFGGAGRGRDYVERIDLPPPGGEIGLPPIAGPLDPTRPLVVIDAGHGGHDPGAGSGELREKTLTLQLARALRDELLAGGGVRVALTRDSDFYLMLPERAGIARRLHADLFISIHADSVASGDASGASVYTLSERGSNAVAEAMAQRENRADTVGGVSLTGTSDRVSSILVDLSQDETAARSGQFARLILREAAGRLPLRDRGVQSAAFIVLKSADLPSVLFESGYISNADDRLFLASAEGRRAFAEVTARAIRVYFARLSTSGGE